jgi:hypothetical protein
MLLMDPGTNRGIVVIVDDSAEEERQAALWILTSRH